MNVEIYRLADQDTNLPCICRHIQRHLGEQTLDPEQSKDLKDVANGDNAKGKNCETVHLPDNDSFIHSSMLGLSYYL